ncbi:M48 family metalloprotease [Candidatus Dependentiae bacterium]
MKLLFSFFRCFSLLFFVFLVNNSLYCIDLRLQEKPSHKNTYDWCTKIAHDNVMEKRGQVLKFLGIKTLEEWFRIKNSMKSEFKHALSRVNSERIESDPFSKRVQRCIRQLLERPCIKKKLNIVKVVVHNKIVAVTSEGKRIEFAKLKNSVPVSSTSIGQSGDVVFINPKHLCRDLIRLDSDLEAAIGHELGHLLQKHVFESTCIRIAFSQRNLSSKKNNLYIQWVKAQEIEADIIGVFDSLSLAESNRSYFLLVRKERLSDLSDSGPHHPTDLERANYFDEICKSMRIDRERVKTEYLAQKVQKTKKLLKTTQQKSKISTTKDVILDNPKTKLPKVRQSQARTHKKIIVPFARGIPRGHSNPNESTRITKKLLVLMAFTGLIVVFLSIHKWHSLFFAAKL